MTVSCMSLNDYVNFMARGTILAVGEKANVPFSHRDSERTGSMF